MSDLREIISDRVDVLDDKVEGLRIQLKAAEAELAEARRALAAIQPRPVKVRERRSYHRNPSYPLSVQAMAAAVVGDTSDPMTAEEVRRAILAKFRTDVPRTSLSPKLSRLVASGVVRYYPDTGRYAQEPNRVE